MDGVSPALAIRSNVGIELWTSTGKAPYEHKLNLPREITKNSRAISFSPEGRFFAYTNGQEVRVLRTDSWELQCAIPREKAFYLEFSPKGNYLCTWELYTGNKTKGEDAPNMFVFELETGTQVFAVVQKNQTEWRPSWSTDELIFALVLGGEALFYNLENEQGFKAPVRRIGGSRGGVLSLAPGSGPPYLAFYTPGAKNSPGMCKLYKYPALSQNQALSCKTFFQADRIEMLWNKRGTGLLLLASTEVDKSGSSYYGNQGLHFMNTKGDSCSVPLSKAGPVHCVKWSPKGSEFIVVYGLMPSKAAIYNLKCDTTFDFEEGPRNCAYFNDFGNLVALAGFGNLPGDIEIWDLSKKEKIVNIKVSDTTYFEWNPNGEYFVTATTAPRLRISNGFKIFHYSGALTHETIWPNGQELLEVKWQQFPENTFVEPKITKMKFEGIKSSQPEASKKAYIPPHLRLIKEGKDPGQFNSSLSKNTANVPGNGIIENRANPLKTVQGSKSKNSNSDKEKKIRNVAKKLSDIKKLKARQEQGETLELNQLNKISQEAKFLEELKALKMAP